jgi:hypothetical protein
MDKFERYLALTSKQIGGLFEIPLAMGYHSYAQFLPDHTFAFYDYLTSDPNPNFAVVTAQPVLFRTTVMALVFKLRGAAQWRCVGHVTIPDTLTGPAVFCRKSMSHRHPQTNEMVYTYHRVLNVPDEELVPITQEECEALELSAVRNPAGIVERLQRHHQLVLAG